MPHGTARLHGVGAARPELDALINVNPDDLTNVTRAIAMLAKSMKDTNENLDAFFLCSMGLLVWFMQCGFAFLEAGSVRARSTTNILIKNVLDAMVGGVAYYAFGWALAYGEPANRFCGTWNWFLIDMPDSKMAYWFYEYVFAASAATIVSGALAERCNFIAYLIYSVVITGIVYPIISHWVWSPDGWLYVGISFGSGNSLLASQFHDFAGSGAVHATGGIASLVGAALLGPRIGRFHPETGEPQAMPGHSVPHVTLGAFVLYFTFLAFNAGSQTTITNPGDGDVLSLVMVNTVLSCCCGGIVGLAVSRLTSTHWSLLEAINGSLAGTVAICSGCNVVHPWAACAIGTVGALIYAILARIVLRLRIDDPAFCVAVHYGGGLWGVLSVAFFRRERGILMAWNAQSGLDLAMQVIGLLAITVWAGGLSLLVFGALRMLNLLRASDEYQIRGVDLMKHGEPAYPENCAEHRDEYNTARNHRAEVVTAGLTRRHPPRRRDSSGMLFNGSDEVPEAAEAYVNPTMPYP